MSDDRLIEIETRLAFQEAAVQELSDLVYAQNQEIDRLNAYCRRLLERIETLSESSDGAESADEPPPHY